MYSKDYNTGIIIYAFKMRQGYLSTSYLDQKYLPSERSETREIWIDPSNVCWDNLVSFWKHMMIFFSHLSLFYRWKYLEKYEKTCQSGTWMLVTLICVGLTFSPRRLWHQVSYVCTPYASNVGDVPEYVYPSHIYMWGNEVVITYMIRVRCVLRGPLYYMTFQ